MRCWGLNRNLRRCCRQGDWKFFCEDHELQPVTALVFIVFTVGAGTASMQSAWFPHFGQKDPAVGGFQRWTKLLYPKQQKRNLSHLKTA